MAKKVLTIKLDENIYDKLVAMCDDTDKSKSELGATALQDFVISGPQYNTDELKELSTLVKYLIPIAININHNVDYICKMLSFLVSGFPVLAGTLLNKKDILKKKNTMVEWVHKMPVKGLIKMPKKFDALPN